MGAVWAGDSANGLPAKLDSAILFAPVGDLVPPALAALERGGTLAIAGIHLSPVPALDYERHMFYERNVRSVTANTRDDGRNLLAEAARAGVRARVTTYPLAEANRALQDLKGDRINGTGVLTIAD
jgi:propanol-preferring alcohol dehydrogenase